MPTVASRVREIRKSIDKKLAKEFDFRMEDTVGRILYIVADEDKKFRSGEAKPVRIKHMRIPPNSLISSCPYSRHGVGHIICIEEEVPMPIEEERGADHCLFLAGRDGMVQKDDLLGVVKLFPIEPLHSGHYFESKTVGK